MAGKLKVFFDGDCKVCSTEISIYQRSKNRGALEFVNILDPGFRPEVEGLDPQRIHNYFHVKTPQGEVLEGVEAFREIWRLLPEWSWAHRASAFRPVKMVMKLGYCGFVRLRPYLPRRKAL